MNIKELNLKRELAMLHAKTKSVKQTESTDKKILLLSSLLQQASELMVVMNNLRLSEDH